MSALSKEVYQYVSNNLGKNVGSGECFDLADLALKSINAKRAKDYGKITGNADYVWGEIIDFRKAVPGDIIQFRNYKMKIVIKEEGWTPYKKRNTYGRSHHTAVVSRNKGNGAILVLEQNFGDTLEERKVRERERESCILALHHPPKKGRKKQL